MEKLAVTQREQEVSEEQRVAAAVAQQDAREAQLRWEEEERRATLLQSIAEHREVTVNGSVVDGALEAPLMKEENALLVIPFKIKTVALSKISFIQLKENRK